MFLKYSVYVAHWLLSHVEAGWIYDHALRYHTYVIPEEPDRKRVLIRYFFWHRVRIDLKNWATCNARSRNEQAVRPKGTMVMDVAWVKRSWVFEAQ